MRATTHHVSISAVRADALFASTLQGSDRPGVGEVREAVAAAVRRFGSRGCAARVAQEFGDHPETAVPRMCWARQLVDETFGRAAPVATCARPLAHARRAA
ncbi:MAG: hypothetical protein AUG44_16320 [Actinobacteria bacterium 13_1_20CM_3_71_11]|nr:MAG: hypothetical protein AUG44_16320 [Actinobacteria bacterium 13_1_20CM_3_71_11]